MSILLSAAKSNAKALLKSGALAMHMIIPALTWAAVVSQFAAKPRVNSRVFYYIERVMNFLNRERLRRDIAAIRFDAREGGDRYDIYEYVLKNHVTYPLDYLEFGVYRGESIRIVLSILPTDCNVYVFDSFEGLPESWYYGISAGEFKVGEVPGLTAPNLLFVKGWFEDTLAAFLAANALKQRLVVHMDADLYAPSIYVLRTLQHLLVPGTVMIFDEYWFIKDEWRALQEFSRETGKSFEYLATTNVRAAIRFTS